MPNSSKKSAEARLFTIERSRKHLYLLILIHSLAAIASFANGLALPYQFLAFLIVIGSAFFHWRDCQHFKPYQIRHSELSGWQLATATHEYQAMQILPSTVLTSQLLILHFRLKTRKTHSLLIFNDALETKDFRALLVDLKISGLAKDKA